MVGRTNNSKVKKPEFGPCVSLLPGATDEDASSINPTTHGGDDNKPSEGTKEGTKEGRTKEGRKEGRKEQTKGIPGYEGRKKEGRKKEIRRKEQALNESGILESFVESFESFDLKLELLACLLA